MTDGTDKTNAPVPSTMSEPEWEDKYAGIFFHPNSRFYSNWNICVLIVLALDAVIIPFRLSFCNTCFMPVLDVIIDVVLLMDIYIGFHLSYMDEGGLVILRSKIIRHYLSTWLFVDLVSFLPMNIFFYVLAPSLNWLRALRLVKYTKSLTYVKFLDRDHRFNKALLRFLEMNFVVFLLAYWIGCMWFSLGYLEGFGRNSFVPPVSLKNAGLEQQLLSSYYWAFTAMTGSELNPETTIEIFFSASVVFIGLSTYATIIGNVGSLISKFDSSELLYQKKMEDISTYMAYRRLPMKLQQRVLNYYEYLWCRKKGLDEEDMLSTLPESLRTEVSLYLNQDIITKVPFFASCSQDFIRQLVSMLKPRVSIPGECVILQGSLGTEMFFLSSGQVEVLVNDERVIVLSSGSFFGEYALLFPMKKRTATIRTLTYCDLFVLRKKDFERVLAAFPEFEALIRETAIQRLQSRVPHLASSQKPQEQQLPTAASPS
jgi:hypothetical protein